MKKLLLGALLLSMSVSGCMRVAWIGYRAPAPNDFSTVLSNGRCMRIGIQNLSNPQLRVAVTEAAAAVCRIFASEEFGAEVAGKTWLASCDLNEDGSADEIAGPEVYRLLRDSLRDFSLNPRKPWDAYGQTDPDPDNLRVAIGPQRIRYWYSEERGELLNTLAHEITHVVSTRFADAGWGRECPQERLVSYGIGNLTQSLWMKQQGAGSPASTPTDSLME